MDATKKTDAPDEKTLQLVLEEISQEQVNNTKTTNDLVSAVNVLTGKFKGLEEKLDKPKPINVTADTRPIQEIVTKAVADVKIVTGTKPVPVVKKYQLLLFPEQDAKLFYRIVFGRWFLFLVLMLLITDGYKLAVHWSDNQREVRRQEVENDRINRAWHYLYGGVDKAGKRLMDTMYNRAGSQE